MKRSICLRRQFEKAKYGKRDAITIIALIIIIICLLIASSHLPDQRLGAIKKELTKQGYNIEGVDFEYVMDGEEPHKWIYQSSAPVYYDGYYVSQWSIFGYTFLSGSPVVHYIVRPYPSLPEPVSVNILFTAEEYERITESASGQPVEEYLKQMITANLEQK